MHGAVPGLVRARGSASKGEVDVGFLCFTVEAEMCPKERLRAEACLLVSEGNGRQPLVPFRRPTLKRLVRDLADSFKFGGVG